MHRSRQEQPNYSWQLYMLYGNLTTLNALRAAKGLNTIALRPHCGEGLCAYMYICARHHRPPPPPHTRACMHTHVHAYPRACMHAGESGDPSHLAGAFLCASSINHGIRLSESAVLQYLYYLGQVSK